MITALLLVVLVLTLMTAVLLPFGGYGSGMDAAGRGMVMYFPILFMGGRALCLLGAVLALAVLGTGNGLAAALLAIGGGVLVVGSEASAFNAAGLLADNPTGSGRALYAFLAVVAAPVVLVIWLFTELSDAEPAQVWIVRALALAAVLGPLVVLRSVRRETAIVRAERDETDAAEEARSVALANVLPPSAPLLEALRYHDRLPESEWRARTLILDAVRQRPDLPTAFYKLLDSEKWEHRILASYHIFVFSPDADAAYFAIVRPTIEEIVRRLRDGVTTDDQAFREASAAIRIAWPAMHKTALPKSLMVALRDAIAARADGTALGSLQHDASLLADLVAG